MKNKYLEQELKKAKKNTDKVWSDIITRGGSIQHLDFLSDKIKEVFKTAIELDQLVLVEQAADRQEFLCQGQSLNLFFPAGADKKELHRSHFAAWKLGTKGLYYLRTETSQRAENVSEKIARDQLKDYETQTMDAESQDECVACQG